MGGLERGGVALTTQQGLQDLLGPDLTLLQVIRVPFVIPDPDGTFQYTYSNVTIFGKSS